MNLKLLINLFSLLSLMVLETKAQKTESLIQNIFTTQTHKIRSINYNDTDYSDLRTLQNVIGSARVIMLGEQDHGDAATFQAKTRLVKFLHKECGFEVLAFESDFYSINSINFTTQEIIPNIKSLYGRRNIYPTWTECKQNEDLFEYLAQNYNGISPLKITGFDCRHTGGYAKDNYVRQLDSIIKTSNLPFRNSLFYADFIQILTDLINKEYRSKVSASNQFKFIQCVDTLIVQRNQLNRNLNDFWNQELKNLKIFAQNSWQYKELLNGYSSNIRDEQMSDNLLWLLNFQYPGKKVIVWSHNFHISNNINQTSANKKRQMVTMGGLMKEKMGDSLYILGFDSYQGFAGSLGSKTFKIKSPSKESIEYYINQNNFDFAFINLVDKSIDKNVDYKMKAFLHKEINGKWLKVFDGIFYIKNMYPCNYNSPN